MKAHIVGVLGLGIFGRRVARELSKYGVEVIAVDKDAERVQNVSDVVTSAVIGDFTDADFLRQIGIQNCDIVVVGTGTNLESSVLAVMHSRKLGVPKIFAKARGTTFEEVLYEVGATRVISPERDSGQALATKILHNRIEEVIKLDENTSIIEFKVPKDWIGKTVLQMDLRREYDLNLIGKRSGIGEISAIKLDEPFKEGENLVGVAHSDTFEKFDYLGYLD